MSEINGNEAFIGIEQTASTTGNLWGTAEDFTSGGAKIRASNVSVTGSKGSLQPNDNGFDNFISTMVASEESAGLTYTCDLAHNALWPIIYACLCGTDTASSEVTSSQGDYNHVITMDSSIDFLNNFVTIAMMTKSDQSLEFPSAKPSSCQIVLTANQIPSVTFNMVADRIVVGSASNTAAEIDALNFNDTHEYTAWGAGGGANDYCRSNAASDGALDSDDDKCVQAVTINIDRGLTPKWCLRGANSAYTTEPRQEQKTNITVSIKKQGVDDDWDFGTIWEAPTTAQKLAVQIYGGQIGTGTNRKTLFEFNNLLPSGPFPSGYGVFAGGRAEPEFVFQATTSEAAPTGMTGLTNGLRTTVTSERSTAYA